MAHEVRHIFNAIAQHGIAFQPLARIDDSYERAWAADWIVAILMREGVQITPEVKEHLWTALTSLASAPVGERTITGLAVLLQSNDLKQALRPFCVGGAYGRLLDAETEHLGSADMQAFEIEGLVGTGAAPAVLAYLFHRIGDRLDGRPTLLIIDEGWLALDDEGFAGQLREWLKTLRKKNASVIFATQSLSDIDGSNIAPAIIESCPTRLLLPNERAIEPQITAIYRRFGLNDRQIEILARATPKRDYYCQSRRGNRLFELGLSEVGLALCAASSKTDQAAIDRQAAARDLERYQRGFDGGAVPQVNLAKAQDDLKKAEITLQHARSDAALQSQGADLDARNKRLLANRQQAVVDEVQRQVDALTLRAPFDGRADWADLARAPQPDEIVRRTFCGT